MTTDAPTVRRSDSIAALAAALAKAQGELKNPPKDSVNPHFKSKYADLATVRDVVMPVLARHGLSVVQLPCDAGDHPALTTVLMHASGEWVETTMRTRPTKPDPQGMGSALTYARRYSLQAIAGVAADDDDDGNAASQPQRAGGRATPPKPADNPQLRAALTADLGRVTDRPSFVAAAKEYKRYADLGQLGPGDVAELDRLFREAGQKYPKPQPAAQ